MSVESLNVVESNDHSPVAVESQPKLLLVDDSQELLDVLQEILAKTGFNVELAASADAALRSLAARIPDMIVCDVMMPEKDGYQLFSEVRSNPEWGHVPFIFLTSLAGRDEVLYGKSSGCDDYLTKPFDPEELVAVLKGKLALAAHRKKLVHSQFEGYRRRIIHTLSHEFRTPLVSINTGTELLLDEERQLNDEQIRRLLESIQRGGYRLERLVNDFMLLQQIDLGHAAASCQRFRRSQPFFLLVESVVESFQESLPKAQVKRNVKLLETTPAAQDARVSIYDVQVAHVIQHLLSNALKFGGPDKPIDVSVRLEGGEIVLGVRDYGPGLSDRDVARACELFSQIGRETTEQQGAGLGLTISQYFTKINNGKLSFGKPEEGNGLYAQLTFSVSGAD
ncbi:MAG: response regulator [Bdellovibrionota bacterium]